jgi:hypothetical protein
MFRLATQESEYERPTAVDTDVENDVDAECVFSGSLFSRDRWGAMVPLHTVQEAITL